MLWLFRGEFGNRIANHPAYNFMHHDHERPDASQVADIAMYLAKHDAVRHGHALHAVLLSFHGGYILTPPSLKEVVECFLENGAVLNTHDILVQDFYVWRPSVLFLFARKSIIFIEGMPTSNHYVVNEHLALVIKWLVSGTLPFTDVQDMDIKLRRNFGNHFEERLPKKFRPSEILCAMKKSPPSLRQLARTKIRSQVAECGKFCRENLMKLPDMPEILKDYVQLADLDQILIRYRSEFEQIFELA